MTDKQLYDACMHMCAGLFKYNITKQEMEHRMKQGLCDEYEFRKRMTFEKDRLRSLFDHLKEVVNNI